MKIVKFTIEVEVPDEAAWVTLDECGDVVWWGAQADPKPLVFHDVHISCWRDLRPEIRGKLPCGNGVIRNWKTKKIRVD